MAEGNIRLNLHRTLNMHFFTSFLASVLINFFVRHSLPLTMDFFFEEKDYILVWVFIPRT